MLRRPDMRESDPTRHPRFWGYEFHEQESGRGGAREILETFAAEFARHAPPAPSRSIPSPLFLPSCQPEVATPVPPSMPVPTNLSNESSPPSAHQITLVAATTGGAIILIFLGLAVIFFRMRCRQRQKELTDTLAREERKGKGAGGMGMLDGEGFGDSVRRHPQQIDYRRPQVEYHLSLAAGVEPCPPEEHDDHPPTLRRPALPPFLFPPRASASGSAFREEVWPPPRQESVFVDPLMQGPADDLSRIVTDIMGHSRANSESCSSLPTYFPVSGAASPRSRRNSASTIYAATAVRSSASTPTLPLSSSSARTESDDDPPWPPTPGTPGRIPGSTPPVSFFQRQSIPVLTMKDPTNMKPLPKGPLRPSTGDGSPRVKNWLERTPRRPDTSPGPPRRAASEGH